MFRLLACSPSCGYRPYWWALVTLTVSLYLGQLNMADVTVCPLFSLLLLKDRGFLEIETFHQKGELDSRDSHVKRKVTHAERQDLKQHVQDKWDCMGISTAKERDTVRRDGVWIGEYYLGPMPNLKKSTQICSSTNVPLLTPSPSCLAKIPWIPRHLKWDNCWSPPRCVPYPIHCSTILEAAAVSPARSLLLLLVF